MNKEYKKKAFVIGNFKMNMSKKFLLTYLQYLKTHLLEEYTKEIKIILLVPSIYIEYTLSLVKRIHLNISIGSQNIFQKESGAYTGEVSTKMLLDFNMKYVLVGHSERRKYFFETNKVVQQKLENLLNNNMYPILCIGEDKEDQQFNLEYEIFSIQLKYTLGFLSKKNVNLSNLIIAYEPIWAIGSSKSLHVTKIYENIIKIKTILKNILKGTELPIIYGGSVDEKNISILSKSLPINGTLIGRASINPDSFIQCIIHTYKRLEL